MEKSAAKVRGHPPSRSWGDLSHKEMSLILLRPEDISEQSQAVSPGLFTTTTGHGAKAGKRIPRASSSPRKLTSPL